MNTIAYEKIMKEPEDASESGASRSSTSRDYYVGVLTTMGWTRGKNVFQDNECLSSGTLEGRVEDSGVGNGGVDG